MKLKDAIANLHQEHPEDKLTPLYTTWGESLLKHKMPPLPEYPRPQLQREHYHMLNGIWKFAIVPITDTTITPGKALYPSGEILVPFSPEALLSGVQRQLRPDEYLWYEKSLSFTHIESDKRCILHFDAVDQQAVVYINGIQIASHIGGYLPFCVDITAYITKNPCLLQVRVRDESDMSYHSRGKQTLKRGGMFYTAQSGIWQSVWYEWVPRNYITSCRITPSFDQTTVLLELKASDHPFTHVSCQVKDHLCPTEISMKSDGDATVTIHIPPSEFHAWTPETPYLYYFDLCADGDNITGYFAMRCFTIEPGDNGILSFHLNHKPYFLHGILDQGYWPDGLMTPPSDEAFLFDIELAKNCGFNMIRKHIKIESMRWYYHCDRLGMIVWQDMVSGGTSYHMPLVCYLPTLFPLMTAHTRDHHYRLFSRFDAKGRQAWEQECMETVDYLYNVPSLATWVPFNEGWGQFDAARIADAVKAKDPTRPVDHASGWFDQKGGDFRSIHNYFRALRVKSDKKRAFVISEYGGFACHIKDHSSVARIYGYRKYDTLEDLSSAFHQLINEQVLPLKEQGLSGAVYTQLSDVEEEVNGLVTYDRKVIKIKQAQK